MQREKALQTAIKSSVRSDDYADSSKLKSNLNSWPVQKLNRQLIKIGELHHKVLSSRQKISGEFCHEYHRHLRVLTWCELSTSDTLQKRTDFCHLFCDWISICIILLVITAANYFYINAFLASLT